jgi:hypothetical protein
VPVGATPLGSALGERLAAGRARTPAQRRSRPVAETRRLAAELAAQQPEATHDDLARQLGISTKRLRTVLAKDLVGAGSP